jgi:hypothetical protein
MELHNHSARRPKQVALSTCYSFSYTPSSALCQGFFLAPASGTLRITANPLCPGFLEQETAPAETHATTFWNSKDRAKIGTPARWTLHRQVNLKLNPSLLPTSPIRRRRDLETLPAAPGRRAHLRFAKPPLWGRSNPLAMSGKAPDNRALSRSADNWPRRGRTLNSGSADNWPRRGRTLNSGSADNWPRRG